MRLVRLTKKEATNKIDGMLHEGYWIEGLLLKEPDVGKPLNVFRYIRNDVVRVGLFNTSPVMFITGNEIHTENSIWVISNTKIITEAWVKNLEQLYNKM